MPGFSAKEVEERATRPMEKLLWEIPGVEYIYSTSREGESLAIVRFKVGEDIERSLVNLNQKLQANFDRIPHGVSFPLIKPKSIDDVPILALTFHGAGQDHLHAAPPRGPSGRRRETGAAGGRDHAHRRRAPATARPARPGEADLAPTQRGGGRPTAAGGQPPAYRRPAHRPQPRGPRCKPAASSPAPRMRAMLSSGCMAKSRFTCATWRRLWTAPEEPAQYVFFGAGAAHVSDRPTNSPPSP